MKISHSKTELYNLCGLKYKFKYIDKLQADVTNSPLLFGIAIDNALNYILESMRDGKTWTREAAEEIFIDRMNLWDGTNTLSFFKSEAPEELLATLDMNSRAHQEIVWDNICKRGIACLHAWCDEILPQFRRVVSVQNAGAIKNAEGDEFVFVLDFIAELQDGKLVLCDNKTSSAKYTKNSVKESHQLSLYKDTFPEIPLAAYCVMIKNPEKVAKKSRTQFIVDEIPEETTAQAYDHIEKTLLGIKKEIFEPNLKSCFAFGKPCEYEKLCKYNDPTGLIPIKKKEENNEVPKEPV